MQLPASAVHSARVAGSSHRRWTIAETPSELKSIDSAESRPILGACILKEREGQIAKWTWRSKP